MTRARRAGAGFTLIEVIISIAILALGMVGVLGMFILAADAHKKAVDQTDVALLAESLLADYTTAMTHQARRASVYDTQYLTGHRFGYVNSRSYPSLWYKATFSELPPGDDDSDEVKVVIEIIKDSPTPAGDLPKRIERFETIMIKRPY